jgi:hypothetical protein
VTSKEYKMVSISEDNVISITMTDDQQDAIMVHTCKNIYRDIQNQIAQLEIIPDLKEYQMNDLIDNQELESACEVLLRWYLTESDFKKFKKEMKNE